MPIKSKAQRRKFAELLVKGEITPEVFERWNREAGDAELPEHVQPKAKVKPKRKATPKPAARKSAAKSKASPARKKRRAPRKRG
jgi:hypothetical protein